MLKRNYPYLLWAILIIALSMAYVYFRTSWPILSVTIGIVDGTLIAIVFILIDHYIFKKKIMGALALYSVRFVCILAAVPLAYFLHTKLDFLL